MIQKDIQTAVHNALDELGFSKEGVEVSYTDDPVHGDIATNAALVAAAGAGAPPRDLAERIVAALGTVDGVERMEIAGPGFINFFCTGEALSAVVGRIISEPDAWGRGVVEMPSQNIMVEFTDPNPFKEFHIGHLMSNTIGESIARVLETAGAHTVHRANYQGDVGPHVAKALWGLKDLGGDAGDVRAISAAYVRGAEAYAADATAKEEIDAINKKIYERTDEELNALYERGKKTSLDHFEELYRTLGTTFDHYFFESETAPVGLEIVKDHPAIFEKSDGAIVYHGENDGLHTRVFVTAHGLPTYETKELGLLKRKEDTWDFDESITITAVEQTDYFRVVRKAMEKVLPDLAAKVRHITHGMMRLEGGKMSSRTGNVVSGELLLSTLTKIAHERAVDSRAEDPEILAKQIAVAAIKYQVLKQATGKNIIFSEERALSLDGDSGPYIQYAHARACSVIEAAENEGVGAQAAVPQTAEERELIRKLSQFPSILVRAHEEREPHYIANYVGALAAQYNSWYAKERVRGAEGAPRLLAVTKATAATLKNGLAVLGIEAPERM